MGGAAAMPYTFLVQVHYMNIALMNHANHSLNSSQYFGPILKFTAHTIILSEVLATDSST